MGQWYQRREHKIILKNSQYNLKLIQNIKVIPLNISFNSKCFFFENEQSKNTPFIKTFQKQQKYHKTINPKTNKSKTVKSLAQKLKNIQIKKKKPKTQKTPTPKNPKKKKKKKKK